MRAAILYTVGLIMLSTHRYHLFIPRYIGLVIFFISGITQAQTIKLRMDTLPGMNAIPAKLTQPFHVTETSPEYADTCRTYTFRIHITAGGGQKIDLKDVYTLPDGNFLLAGNSFSTPATSKGFIGIMNNAGVLQVQKDILVNNSPTTILTAKANYEGNIFIAGAVHEGGGKVFIASLNAALATNWVTVLEIGQISSVAAVSILDNGKIAVAAQAGTDIKIAVLNNDGTIHLTRQCTPAGMLTLAGIGHNFSDQVSLVVNCNRAGMLVTDVITFDGATGIFFSSHTAGTPAEEFQMGKVTAFGNRVIVTGVKKYSDGQYKLIRQLLHTSNLALAEQAYELALPAGFTCRSATDAAGDAPAFCFPQQGKLVYIRHFADSQTSPEYTRSYDVGTGSSIAGVSRSIVDGGYIFGINTGSQDSIILIKTDSIGLMAGCSYSTLTNNYTETLNIQNTVSATGISSTTITANTGIWQQTTSAATLFTDCKQIYCPPPPAEDTCLSTFVKTFRSNSFSDHIYFYELMRNNTHLVRTTRYDRVLGSNLATYTLKLMSERGGYIKGKTIYTNGVSSPVSMYKMDDQHVMLIQNFTGYGNVDINFSLVNDSLDIVWSKSVESPAGYNFTFGTYNGDITKDAEGNYYFVAHSGGFNETAKLLVYKMDANGNQVWIKVHELPQQVFGNSAITTTSTSVVVVLEGSTNSCLSVRLDKTTGQFINAWNYQNLTGGSTYKRFLRYENGYIWYTGNRYENINYRNSLLLMLFDTTGRPVKMSKLNVSSLPRAVTAKNGKLYAWFDYYDGSNTKWGLLCTDTSFVPSYINSYEFNQFGFPRGLGVGDNGALYSGGYFSSGNASYSDAYLRKTDAAGITGTCPYQPAAINLISIPLSPVFINSAMPINYSFNPAFIPVVFVPDTAGYRAAEILCSSTPLCNSVQVTGPQVVCRLNQQITYLAQRNPGCNLRPVWIYDTAFAVLQSVTDTSAVFTFRRTGTTKLYSKLNTGCYLYTDSIEVTLQSSPASFSLGADALLCPGDSLILNAGTGFSTYLWQDGSTDSVLTVYGPGQYHVQTSNGCGERFADTINIGSVIVPPLNIGPDVRVCIKDTLYLQAQPGFSVYNWFPAGIVTGNGQQAFAVPGNDLQVWIRAITAEGCIKTDTLSVTSISAPPVFLGRDTSFCIKDSIVIAVGSGYQQYIWSTGSVSSSIVVKQAGQYWVKATAANGCHAKDTMAVLQTYTLPQPSLGNDFNLCSGTLRRLDPGTYSAYLWHDGSTAPFFSASQPGTYHVKVTDANRCSAADTVAVLQVLPSPAGFLPAADSICEYSSVVLSPAGNFSSYQWSTGSVQKSITVTQPGKYVLTVWNSDGCYGKDTVLVVQKNCYTGVSVPTGFTPNNDGLNDLIKPVVHGSLLQYSFELYDRAGQRIFYSTNPLQGWDGRIKGELQPSGLYVWQCRYQLAGQVPGYQKGTVMLIR